MTGNGNDRAVVLLSGGLDSTTVCAIAKREGRKIYPLSFDYGQRNRAELDAAREVVSRYVNGENDGEYVVFELGLAALGGSSLTDKEIPVAKNVPIEKIGERIPTSYVFARNTIFLSIALAYAESREAGEVWIGVNQTDYSGYPDCRGEYISAFQRVADLGTKRGATGRPIRIKTPLLHLSKADIITLGTSLGVDYSITKTCYDLDDKGRACGRCESCLLRKRGFKDAGIDDPTLYRDDR